MTLYGVLLGGGSGTLKARGNDFRGIYGLDVVTSASPVMTTNQMGRNMQIPTNSFVSF